MRAPELDFTPTVPALLARAVERHGDADFVVTPERRCSFREAERCSRRARRADARGGARQGRAGRDHVPLGDRVDAGLARHHPHRRDGDAAQQHLPATRKLRDALRIGDVSLLLAPRTLLGRDLATDLEEAVSGMTSAAPRYLPALPYLRDVWLVDRFDLRFDDLAPDAATVTDELLTAIEAEVTPADACVVVYTSGSAATPKAIVHTHGTVVRKTATESQVGLPASFPGQRVLCAMPFFWVGGVQMLAGALHSGSTVVCQERFDAEGALDLIERERVTTMLGWATAMTAVGAAPPRAGATSARSAVCRCRRRARATDSCSRRGATRPTSG